MRQFLIAGFIAIVCHLHAFGSENTYIPYVMECCSTDYRVQVGGNYTWVSMHPDGESSFSGNLGGAQAVFEYRPMNNIYGGAKLTLRDGEIHGSWGKRSVLYIDAQERLGYTFGCQNDDWSVTLYTGFGYRYNAQKLDPKDGSSLKFRYNEFYIPVGTSIDYSFNPCFAMGLGFTWMPQIFPTLAIDPLKGAHWTLTNQLANFFVELPFIFTLPQDQRFAVIINPFYEYWQDGRTTAETEGGQELGIPRNTYNYVGVEVNIAFSF